MIALILLAGVAAGAETSGSQREDRVATAPPAGTFLNPVLAGDWPDASIVRVGGDYYMTHTSGVYAPGLLIWHSKDLVHWEPVTHALKRFDGDVWSPDLVHHKGRLKKVFDSQNVSGYTAQTFGSFLSLRPGLYCAGEEAALFRNFKFQHLPEAK